MTEINREPGSIYEDRLGYTWPSARSPRDLKRRGALISAWIREHVASPLIIGPDSESEQWVSAVAKDADAPHSVLEKIRHGDRDVEISVRTLPDLTGRTPVLVDDIMHRYGSLSEIYRIPARVVHAAPVAPYEFNLC